MTDSFVSGPVSGPLIRDALLLEAHEPVLDGGVLERGAVADPATVQPV